MGLHRDIYAERSNLVPAEFLQSLFVAELILPSSCSLSSSLNLSFLNQSQGGNYILERWQRHGRCKHQCVGSGL